MLVALNMIIFIVIVVIIVHPFPATTNYLGMEEFRMTDAEYMSSLTGGQHGSFVFFEVLEPEELRYTFKLSPSSFSPPFNATSLPDPALLVPADPASGCGGGHLHNAHLVHGHVLLVERGECSFVSKTLQAQKAGAVAVVVADSDRDNDDLFVSMVDDLTGRKAKVEIPAGFLLGKDGHRIRRTLERLRRDSAIIRIPVNITGYRISQLKQPPWLVW